MKKLKVAVVGLGGIGLTHVDCLKRIEGAELVAVCDVDAPRTDSLAAREGVKAFYDYMDLIKSGLCQAITIATPHYFHTPTAVAALDGGIHVLTEKPIAVHVNDAQKMVDAAGRNPKTVFSAMFQLRLHPAYRKVKQLIEAGELGEIRRVNWVSTKWFRTQLYYDSGGWRGTWKGEGGGVLLNQCPHNLDMLQWLCGMPDQVRGFCGIGQSHAIEVEDDVTAYLHFPNGATGVFIASTGESPGVNRLEIAGDRGLVTIDGQQLSFQRTTTSVREFLKTATGRFAEPEVWKVEIPVSPVVPSHQGLIENFVQACVAGAPLAAPGVEGMNSIMLSNAMLLSSLEGRTLNLPIDGDAFEKKLAELIAASTFQKKVVEGVDLSFDGSSALTK